MEFCCHNERVGKKQTNKHFVGYVLQNTRFRCFTERHRKWRQTMSKNYLKIKLWVLSGEIFQIWGGFLRGLILGEFSICTNSVETLEQKHPWARLGGTSLKIRLQVWGWRGGKGGRYQRFIVGDIIGNLIWQADPVGRRNSNIVKPIGLTTFVFDNVVTPMVSATSFLEMLYNYKFYNTSSNNVAEIIGFSNIDF